MSQMLEKHIYKSREEWLAHRHGIGGSDAAAVMGLSPWKSNVQLWEELTGRRKPADISDSPVVQYGTQAEKYLRDLFALDFPEYEVGYDENNCFTSALFPYAHASLDGYLTEKETGRQGILEIKTTNITSAVMLERWTGGVPDHYYCQVLWYLLVTGWSFAVLKAQLKFFFGGDLERIEIRHYRFERQDCLQDMESLAEEAKDFWHYVETDKCPPLKLNI